MDVRSPSEQMLKSRISLLEWQAGVLSRQIESDQRPIAEILQPDVLLVVKYKSGVKSSLCDSIFR